MRNPNTTKIDTFLIMMIAILMEMAHTATEATDTIRMMTITPGKTFATETIRIMTITGIQTMTINLN